MGLDAVVFRNVNTLEQMFGSGLFDVDNTTGEALLHANSNQQVPREAFFAVKKRLGNLAEIAHLRQAIGGIVNEQSSTILHRVLYSAFHSGDSITPDDLARLKIEVDQLRMLDRPELREFVESMSSLVTAAETETNPIVFV